MARGRADPRRACRTRAGDPSARAAMARAGRHASAPSGQTGTGAAAAAATTLGSKPARRAEAAGTACPLRSEYASTRASHPRAARAVASSAATPMPICPQGHLRRHLALPHQTAALPQRGVPLPCDLNSVLHPCACSYLSATPRSLCWLACGGLCEGRLRLEDQSSY